MVISKIVEILKMATKDPSMLRGTITTLQDLVWNDLTDETPEEQEILRDLAYDLDYYEPDPMKRQEDPSFLDDEKVIAAITEVLMKLG